MMPNRFAVWFGRALWLGIFVNLAFAVPALLTPRAFHMTLGLGGMGHVSTIWLRNAGMLLLPLCGFYALVARDPLTAVGFARWSVAGRFLAAAFWLWLVVRLGMPKVVWWFFATDFALALLQGFLLWRALAVTPPPAPKPWRPSLFSRIYAGMFRLINRVVAWDKLPPLLAAQNLAALRDDLREKNLYDTPDEPGPPPPWKPEYATTRSADGTFNDLSDPWMGSAEARFGRNAPLADCWPKPEALLTPSPREVSRRLLARPIQNGKSVFQPVPALNLLAGAWIQFQNHGWFNHLLVNQGKKRPDAPEDFLTIPLADGDDWVKDGERVMRIRRTLPDPTRPQGAGYPPTFRGDDTQWWDASQVYGNSKADQDRLRTKKGGLMTVDAAGFLPDDPEFPGLDLTGFSKNWWLGLSLLHTLFVKEHNSICAELAARHPGHAKDDEWLYQKARLTNAALMAKIHTVEWTPGILGHPALKFSMSANWWGILGPWVKEHFGRLSDAEAVSGIVGSRTQHHAARHMLLTEEFVAVYRLHPLIPDDLTFRAVADHSVQGEKSFVDVQGLNTRRAMQSLGSWADLYYTFGVEHPGQIRLRNFPNSLRDFQRVSGDRIDLAAIDILRDRERGVPRYNRFREILRKPRIASFEELTGLGPDAELVHELNAVYGKDNVDALDLQVGLMAEPPPQGFGFSDTAFRIFILMASRRLKSDRFFTTDFTPDVYTQTGLDWIEHNTMASVLIRHHPELEPALRGLPNPFGPWNHAGGRS